MLTHTLDLLGKDLQVGDYFLYFCAAKHGNISICKILDITDKGFKCNIVKFSGWKKPYRGRTTYYTDTTRMFKISKSQLNKQVLNLLNKD